MKFVCLFFKQLEFVCVFVCFVYVLGVSFLDSSRFSASVAQIFTPKGVLGPDFGPKQKFEKS